MHHVCEPVCFIVPPHIIRALAEHKDRRIRDAAMRTMALSGHLRGRREVLGQLPLGAPAGQKRRTIYDAQHGTQLPGKLLRGEGDPATSDDAVNEAYDGLGATYDMYFKIFQRNSVDDHGMRLDASVHYDRDFDNAFWDGRQMVFGDGDGIVFVGFTKAIDVIGHELTHGVTQYTAKLEYQDQPGALNESFSDVFGSLVKQYHNGDDVESADWLIGSGILAPGVNGKALRSMKAPGTAYDDPKLGGKDPQPAKMADYIETSEDNGGVHLNSGIPNHAFYLVAEQLGGNAWDDAGHIWYQTLLRLKPNAQFQDCANVSFQVAGELYGAASAQQQAVRSAWSEVGISVVTSAPRPRRTRERVSAGEGNGAFKKQLERLSDELKKTIESMA
jgi:Zn-dependent metalloprotease